MVNPSLITVVGLSCAIMLVISFGFVVPLGNSVANVCEILTIPTAVFLVGLLEGE